MLCARDANRCRIRGSTKGAAVLTAPAAPGWLQPTRHFAWQMRRDAGRTRGSAGSGNRRTVDPAVGRELTGSKANEPAKFVMRNDAGAGAVFEPASGEAELRGSLHCIEERLLDGSGRRWGGGGHAFGTGNECGIKVLAGQCQPAAIRQWHEDALRCAQGFVGGGRVRAVVL